MDTQEILDNVDTITLEAAALESNQTELCKIWPVAKQALEILASLVTNIIVKKAIQLIIAAGDAVVGKVCN